MAIGSNIDVILICKKQLESKKGQILKLETCRTPECWSYDPTPVPNNKSRCPWLKISNIFQDDIKDPEEQLSILKNGASLARPEETNNI